MRSVAHDVKVVTVRDCPTAVVACTTTWSEFPALWKGLLDKVWAFLANTDLRTDGHNIMLYRDVGTALQVEVGVQVARAFEPAGVVVPSKLPAGRAAMTTHRGSYDGLAKAHQAVLNRCATQGLQLSSTRWEIYGDWNEDPLLMETEIYWLLC